MAQSSSVALQAPLGPAIPATYKARSFGPVGVVSEVRKCLGGASREASWRLARTGIAQQQLFLEAPDHLRRQRGTSYPTSPRVPQTHAYPNLVGALGKKADLWADKRSATAVRQGTTDFDGDKIKGKWRFTRIATERAAGLRPRQILSGSSNRKLEGFPVNFRVAHIQPESSGSEREQLLTPRPFERIHIRYEVQK